jgi:5-methylcytosine-specific restriction endonuclease McrA
MVEQHLITPTKRRSMTKARAAKIFLREQGKCYICGVKLRVSVDPYEIEHPEALSLGGSDNDEDLRVVCLPCHKPKTAQDAAKRAQRNAVVTKTWSRPETRKSALAGPDIKYSRARGCLVDRRTGEPVQEQ